MRQALVVLALAASAAPASAASVTRVPGTGGCAGASGCAAVTGLHGGEEAVVSPDGTSLYVAANAGEWGAILSFARDPATGTLTQLAGRAGCLSFDGRAGPDDTEAKVCQKVPTTARASDVTISPDGRTVYTVGSDPFVEAIDVWRRDAQTGALTRLECRSALERPGCTQGPFIEPDKLVLSPDGKRLTVGGGSLTSFVVNADGTLGDGVCSFRFARSTGGARQACASAPRYGRALQIGALAGSTTGTGTRIFAVADAFNSGGSARVVARFTLDPVTGLLTAGPCAGVAKAPDSCSATRALSLTSGLAVTPSGNGAYTAGYDDVITDEEDGSGYIRNSAIGVFTGALGQLPGAQGCTLFTGRKNPGCATRPATHGAGFRVMNAVAVVPGGGYVLAGFGDGVALLKRNTRTQALTPLAGPAGCVGAQPAARCSTGRAFGGVMDLALTADGRYAYAISDESISAVRVRR